jgi:nickel/cobalt transporter (NicO) family protein
MTGEMIILAGTAATIGLVHTIFGPDHYLPFIALSKARKWGTGKTTLITLFCGLGHILGSVALGFIGIGIGAAIFSIEAVESFRGEIAAWFLIAFGFTYSVWGIHRALRARRHEHQHLHENGEVHSHAHSHVTEHTHVHSERPGSVTPWVLFIIFVFGPCEPLIPLIMYPAAEHDMMSVVLVATIFGVTTIATMLAIVLAANYGLSKVSIPRLERYSHALAGLSILLCGAAVKFLGL